MYYQVLSPFFTEIEGDTLAEAIKMFVKTNYANQIRNMIIADQMNKYNASITYYNKHNKNKIGIEINKDPGYTVYPSNSYVQPIYKEHDNGTSSDIVGMGIPLSLTPMQYQPKNTIKATPVITSPGMISTTNSGIVSSFPRFGFM
jgi:hypothetical protein